MEEQGKTFDVWALSCIGAWVGVVYNQYKDNKADRTRDFFREHVFREDHAYSGFPINRVFGPDLMGTWAAFNKFIFDPKTYFNAWVPPHKMMEAAQDVASFLSSPNEGNLNHLALELSAKNPISRFYMSMMYLSKINGMTKLYYPDGNLLETIDFDKINKLDEFIYHNAWNLTERRIEQFANRPDLRKDCTYGQLTAQSLCACSALPYIEQTVDIGNSTYCEGALVDTVNLKRLLSDHGEHLDEIYISRIVDEGQVRKPENLHDALGNLCQLFAATVGEDDIKLFESSVRDERRKKEKAGKPWTLKIFEIDVEVDIDFDWTHSNLERAIDCGRNAPVREWDMDKLDAFEPPCHRV